MPEIKNNFVQGKMNKDLDDRLLPNGQYRDAQNITISKSENSDVGTVQNVKGNSKLFIDDLSVTTETKTIGHYIDSLTGEIFWFITNFNGQGSDETSSVQYAPTSINGVNTICKILYAKTDGATPKVLVDSFRLNLSKNHKITHVNRLDDLLFWTDNYNQPRRINIQNALSLNNPYTNDIYLEDKISVAQYAPYAAPIVKLSYDSSIKSKTIEEEFVKFGYRFKYDNNEYSLISPFSQHCFHPGSAVQSFNDGTYSTSPLSGTTNSAGMAGMLDQVEIDSIAKTTVVDSMINKANKVSLLITLPFDENITNHASAAANNNSGLSGTSHIINEVSGTISVNNSFIDENNNVYTVNGNISAASINTSTAVSPNIPDDTRLYFFNITEGNGQWGWNNNLKIKEIEILYSESDSAAIKVIDTIKIGQRTDLVLKPIVEVIDTSLHTAKLRYTYEYIYKSTKPKKTLPEADLVRVSDIIPIKAQTQEVSGNRIIYGNILQNRNITQINPSNGMSISSGDQGTKNKQYLLSSVKSNRTYQVGIVLSDKYGRQSPVILPEESTTFVEPKSGVVTNGASSWNHSCLRATFTNSLANDIYNATTNPLGWYSYRFVVKQTEQDYYNVYSPQVIEAGTVSNANDQKSFILLHGDNINKVPRDVNDTNTISGNQGSNARLLPKIRDNNLLISNYTQLAQIDGTDFIKVTSIGTALEQGLTGAIDSDASTDKSDVLANVYFQEKNPLFAELPDGYGTHFNIWGSGSNKDFSFFNFETQPFVSIIDIYYETSSAGLLDDLNKKIEASAGEAPTNISITSTTFNEASSVGTPVGTLSALKSTGAAVSPGATFVINSVINGLGTTLPNSTFAISGASLNTGALFNFTNTSEDQFSVSITATRNGTSETYTKSLLLTLQNVNPVINVGSGNNVSNATTGVTIAAVLSGQATTQDMSGTNGGKLTPNSDLTFSIVSQTNPGRYTINSTTGVISAGTNLSNGMVDTLVMKTTDVAGSSSPNTSLKISVTGSPFTQFWRGEYGNATVATAVDERTAYQVWHDGNSALPNEFDTVYSNPTGTTPFSTGSATDGSGGQWFSMCGPNYCSYQVATFVFKTSSDGVVRAVTIA
jgi:hypothetical protein